MDNTTDEIVTVDTEVPEAGEQPPAEQPEAATDETAGDDDTFPRSYVEQLRQENGKYRQRAQRADDLAHRLHRALVDADGRLHDPSDLEFADEHLDDAEALAAAIDALLEAKPHLAAPPRPTGDVGQGVVPERSGPVDLLHILGGR